MSNARFSSLSRIHLLGLGLLALITLALLAAPSKSRAADQPFKIDFDQSSMQIGLLSDLPLGDLATTGSLEGTIDEEGNVTIPKGNFILPEIGITDPIAIKVFMGVESDATGTYDANTGELVLNAKAGVWFSVDLQALLSTLGTLGVQLPAGSGIIETILGQVTDLTCGFSPMDVTFTTGETSQGSGAPFSEGPLGPGALTAEWSQLGPFAGKTKILGLIDACQAIKMYAPTLLESALGSSGIDLASLGLGDIDLASLLDNLDNLNLGPSSLTLTRTLDESPDPPAAEPVLKMSVKGPNRKVKAGSKAEFTVKVRNSGQGDATGVRVCLKSSGPVIVQGSRCRTLGKVMAGATQTRHFKVKAKKGKKKSAKISFSLKSSNGDDASASTRLLIRH